MKTHPSKMEGFFIFNNFNYKPLLPFKAFTHLPLTTP
jgi:hypothetical protein